MSPRPRPFVSFFWAICLLGSFLTAALGAQVRVVKDIWPGPSGSSPSGLYAWNGRLYFSASIPSTGTELWSSDGTSKGTVFIKDIVSGVNGSFPDTFMGTETKLFFRALTPATGRELWVTDGTSAGTHFVKDLNPGTQGIDVSEWAPFGDRIVARIGTTTIVISDGTARGTYVLESQAGSFAVLHGRILLAKRDPQLGFELFVSDGTAKGTHLLKDIYPGSTSSAPANLTVVNGLCYFSAVTRTQTGSTGREPFVTDGTAQGTRLIADLEPYRGSSFPADFTGSGKEVYFTARTSKYGRELYRLSSPSPSLFDVRRGRGSSTPLSLTGLGDGRLLFTANDGVTGVELWLAQPGRGPIQVKDIHPTGSSQPSWLVASGSRFVWFAADNGKNGKELWRSDGTAAGTQMVQDLCFPSCSSFPNELTLLGCDVFFTATITGIGDELVAVRAGAGTMRIGRGCALPGSPEPRLAASDPVLGGKLSLRGFGAPNPAAGALLFGAAAQRPVLVPCPIYLDPALPVFPIAFSVSAASWSLTLLTIPLDSSLMCRSLGAQVLYKTGSSASSLRATNGLVLTFGK